MKVVVIGAGVAGISAAWHLDQGGVQVHLIEAGTRLGGHTHTHQIEVRNGSVSVDTGFIVFNENNYPEFCHWLRQLGIDSQSSIMSFAVRDEIDALEYGTTDLRSIVANSSQLARPAYWSLWRDVIRFYRRLREGALPDTTLGEYLSGNGYGHAFVHSHIVPMCAALWSQPADESLQLSLRHVIEFMRNHKMLQLAERPDWRVIKGGSSSYLRAFKARFRGQIVTDAPITEITREGNGVGIRYRECHERFDAAVLACHSDQALSVLADATTLEKNVLGGVPYQNNAVYLHNDAAFMPRNKSCWSSWNVIRGRDGSYTITYWMNRLQGLTCSEQFFVTLNPAREPRQVCWQGSYQHPLFTKASYAAQQKWTQISRGPVQYAGAYWGSGFHEDGFVSGQRCARAVLEMVSADAA
ncbi:MAG: FAD-dependent oxidoreductase [Pseudomonadota bacterium]|nr:FAD-dependent oxidoreductase [Pseudomonadota bacterium]